MIEARGQRSVFGTEAATINAQLFAGRHARALNSLRASVEEQALEPTKKAVRFGSGVYRDGRTPRRLHNYRLNPPTFASRRLLPQASRRSARGLAVR